MADFTIRDYELEVVVDYTPAAGPVPTSGVVEIQRRPNEIIAAPPTVEIQRRPSAVVSSPPVVTITRRLTDVRTSS